MKTLTIRPGLIPAASYPNSAMTHSTFSDEDRRLRDDWIRQIPDAQAPLFNAVALQIRHDTAGLHMVTQNLLDLYARQHADIQATLALLQAQERRLTTVAADLSTAAADLALLRAQVEPFGQMLTRLDSGLTILEGLEQADVQHLAAVIGPADPDDPRTIREHLRDQDAQRTQLNQRVTGRLNWLTGAVAVLGLIALALLFIVLAAPPPVFGGVP